MSCSDKAPPPPLLLLLLASSTLAISERQGEFDGMVENRDIRVRVIRGEQTDAADFSVVPATVVRYEGTAQSVSL